MLYFLTFSTLALVIGMIVSHVVQPGAGMHIDPASLDQGAVATYVSKAHDSTISGFLMNIIPATMFSPFVNGDILSGRVNSAALEGVLGFLPNKTKEEICAEMKAALIAGGLKESDFDLSFMYRHDCSVVDPQHELPQGLLKAAEAVKVPLRIDAFTASCDAWFYNNQLGIPTVVLGAGTLKVAHSIHEHIEVASIGETAKVLVDYIAGFCKEA